MRRHAVTRAEPPDGQDDSRVSLHPLTFEEALKGLLKVKPKKSRPARDTAADDEEGGGDGQD